MREKTYLRILQAGVIASLFIVFFVFKDLLFPYITSKQISFNILTELMFAFYLVFILRFPKYRPRKNWITFGLLAFLAAISLSLTVSVDRALSFWADAERMLGIFHIFHFFLLYLIILSVFRSWKDWQALFISSVVVATIVSLGGIFGENTYSYIGNTAYVSGYLIFNIFFASILFFREGDRLWRWLYAVPVLIMLYEFWLCRTSGAIIGLFLSILLAFFLIGILHNNLKIRRGALISFIVAIIAVIAIFSQSQSTWFQNSFLRNLTSQKVTFQTRLVSWEAALQDFKNHPVLGTGFGNYAIIFDKYFDSRFFNYTTSETYFDRAHNNLIDIGSTTGLVGLLAYLSIFVAALFYLFREMKVNGWRAGGKDLKERKNLEIIIIVSLLAAYFIQNLAIFDSYVTYIGLMIILAFISWLRFDRLKFEDEIEEKKPLIRSANLEIICLILFLLIAYIFTANFNIKPRKTLQGVIKGYSLVLSGDFDNGLNEFKGALKDGPLDRDGRTVVTNLFVSNFNNISSLPKEKAEEIVEYAVLMSEKNLAHNSKDSLANMQQAQVLEMAGRFYDAHGDREKALDFSSRALEAINRSIDSSPGRAPLYFTKAQMLMVRGQNEEAIAELDYGISLNPNYYEGYCRGAQFYDYLKNEEKLYESLDACIDLGGISLLTSNNFIGSVINRYIEAADYEKAIILAKRLVELNPKEAEIKLSLAKLYLISGQDALSEETLQEAYKLNPLLVNDWQDFLRSLIGADIIQEIE